MEDDRIREARAEDGFRAGIALLGQILTGLCLFVLPYAGSPAWLCVLGTAPYLFLCRFFSRRAADGGKISLLFAALAAFLDALAAYVPLSALCQALLTDLHPWAAAALPALFAAGAAGGRERTLAVLSRPAALMILLPLLYCVFAALPQIRIGRLFPLLGKGMGAIGVGAVWMWGCVSCACLPGARRQTSRQEPRRPLLPLLAALLLGAGAAALYALLLPYGALIRPASLADRLTALRRFASPTWGWPLMTGALILLLFYALASALDTAAGMLSAARERKGSGRLLTALLALALLPIGAAQSRTILRLLIWILPARAALTMGLWMALCLKKIVKGASSHA